MLAINTDISREKVWGCLSLLLTANRRGGGKRSACCIPGSRAWMFSLHRKWGHGWEGAGSCTVVPRDKQHNGTEGYCWTSPGCPLAIGSQEVAAPLSAALWEGLAACLWWGWAAETLQGDTRAQPLQIPPILPWLEVDGVTY